MQHDSRLRSLHVFKPFVLPTMRLVTARQQMDASPPTGHFRFLDQLSRIDGILTPRYMA